MAKATPLRSGDELAGCSASSDAERAAAQCALADSPLDVFLEEMVVPYEDDEVTRLIIDSHDRIAFQRVSHPTVGGPRDWLLDVAAGPDPLAAAATIAAVSPAITPEMAAAVSKLSHLKAQAFTEDFHDEPNSGGGALLGILAAQMMRIPRRVGCRLSRP